jgi:predicted acetyltransferase
VNRAHFEELAKKLKYGFEHYFSKYGNKQYHLWLLVTHPNYRRRGAATRLCKWGMDGAIEKDYISTVIGSPMGTIMYTQLGFLCVGSVTIQVDGEDEHFEYYCLEDPKKKE